MSTTPHRFTERRSTARRSIRALLAPVMPVLLALVGTAAAGGVIVALLGYDPLAAYGAMVEGAFGGRGGGNLIATINRATPIAGLALAAALALRGGLLNLGGEGQAVLGALGAAALAPHLAQLAGPLAPLAPLLCLLAGALAGGLYAQLAATLAGRCGVPLLVGTLLLNYPARYAATYAVSHPLRDIASGLAQSHRIPAHASLPLLGGRLDTTAFGVLVITLVAAWALSHTRAGLGLRMTGENPRFARYAGVELGQLGQRTMWLSGAIAGAVGAAAVLAVHHRFIDGALTRPGYAWTALMAALLAGARPLGTLAASVLFAAIQTGGFGMERHAGVPRELSQILQAMVILLIAAAGHAALGGRAQRDTR